MQNISESTFFINLSSLYWKPVKFEFLNEQFSFKSVDCVFNNGMIFNINEFLKDCIDYKSNNNTGLFLTDIKKASFFLQDKDEPFDSNQDLVTIKSPIGTINTNTSSTIVKLTSVGLFYSMITSDTTIFNDNDVFDFIFYPAGYVMIKNKDDYYLTSKTGSEAFLGNLEFQPKIFPDNQAQQFDYFLGKNTISLFEIDDEKNLQRFKNAVVANNLTSGIYVLSSLTNLTSAEKFPTEATFEFLCYNDEASTSKNNIKDSFLAKYIVTPDQEINELVLDEEIKNMDFSQNYLGIFPNENVYESSLHYSYPIYTHSLKNYQTPEYKYSFGFDFLENQNGIRRIYDKIFSGTNQIGGSENLFLGFTSNTMEINFPSDKTTAFYFPPTINKVHIKDSGLIEDGAIAGEIPYVSDRIFVKKQDYSELIPDTGQPESLNIKSNVWLCSWLSGSLNGDKVWMDRYYNAAYYTLDQALSTKALVYNEKLNPELLYTYDKPSQMYFEPGALYKYFHTGQENRKTFLNYFSSASISQITNWSSEQLKYDYENFYAIVYDNKDSKNLAGDYLNLDGTNYVLFPATTKMLEQYKLTVSMWIYVDDWNYIDGSQIFGNYYNSGYGLINESSVTTPIITLVDQINNDIYNLNYRFSVLSKISIANSYKQN
jgi:hypothetical protein